jgi:spermidine synthase
MDTATVPRSKRPVSAARAVLTLIGFSAVIGQIILIREFIVAFNGNELSMGLLLATWLFWTAAGSSLSGGFALGRNCPRRAVAALEGLLGVSMLPTTWALRVSRTFFQTVPGELVGPVPMLLISLACLSLFCVVSGALFVVAIRMYEQECDVSARVATSSAYWLEAAGSGFGGILASVVLLRFLGSFQIAIVVALMNVCMATVLWFRMSRKQLGVTTFSSALVAILLVASVAPPLDRLARASLWRGFRMLGSRDSIYGNLTVIEAGNLRSIYDNGVILASVPDENAAEESVHYALLEHPAPRRLLLIGGGVNGSIAQALRHPTVERIDYVELDPALIDIARQYFPAEYVPFVTDSRVHMHYADGRFYLKTTGDTFDVIIVNVPDPQTAQLNRFYTSEFFRSASDHLASGGLLALQLRSSEDYMSPDLAEFLRCIHRTLQEAFPFVATIPGETIHFFASARPDVLTDNPQTLISRLQERNLHTKYVREYFIPFRMMPDRMAHVHEQLQPLASTPVNRDYEPIAYYFDVVLWSAQFKLGYSRWFRAGAHLSFTSVIGTVFIVLLSAAVPLGMVPIREKRARAAAGYCMAATGFTLMALQVFLLLAFQSVYGYVYHQLAVLIAMGMAGIAFGSWLGIRRIRVSDSPAFSVATTQLLLALSAPALICTTHLLSKISGVAATWFAAQCIFPALAALCGMLGGYQFPVATKLYLHESNGRSGLGTLYAVDLLGGCAGALLLSSYLIPVFGFWKTAWLSAAVSLVPALLAARVVLEAKTYRV